VRQRAGASSFPPGFACSARIRDTLENSVAEFVGFTKWRRNMTSWMRRIELAVGLALIARVLWLAFRHDGGALDFTWSARG